MATKAPTKKTNKNPKSSLLAKCRDGHDRSNWEVAYAKRDLKQHGVLVVKKGEPVLYDPNSIHYSDYAERDIVTVYLARNLGGMDTYRFHSEFVFTN